jgi:hypothetical protein
MAGDARGICKWTETGRARKAKRARAGTNALRSTAGSSADGISTLRLKRASRETFQAGRSQATRRSNDAAVLQGQSVSELEGKFIDLVGLLLQVLRKGEF